MTSKTNIIKLVQPSTDINPTSTPRIKILTYKIIEAAHHLSSHVEMLESAQTAWAESRNKHRKAWDLLIYELKKQNSNVLDEYEIRVDFESGQLLMQPKEDGEHAPET